MTLQSDRQSVPERDCSPILRASAIGNVSKASGLADQELRSGQTTSSLAKLSLLSLVCLYASISLPVRATPLLSAIEVHLSLLSIGLSLNTNLASCASFALFPQY